MKFDSIISSIGNTPLVEIPRLSPKEAVHIYVKLEGQNPTGSLKDRIAKYMVADAEARGVLTAGKTILEATSGNTGISLAMIGHRKGYAVKVVMPENVSPERCHLLLLYGAEVVFSDGTKG
ncbi:MAG: pyridoxal-phosphate dependent enzyme, partial [Dehalococcoidia bacterium]|nr:pyridoxal-phosphate dependent enzyme [Dehalococcoidia bacterium]